MISNNNLHDMLTNVSDIVKSHEKNVKLTGERLNLFSILRKEHDEVRLHSRFIAELLNPLGKHDQGTLFLDLFFQVFEIKNMDSSKSKIFVEFYTGVISKDKIHGGNIDILIDDGNNCVKIENKIYAGEQPNQLLRYHNYKNGSGMLIFLTLFGDPSKADKALEQAKIRYAKKSYSKDITKWLDLCITRVQFISNLNESITQYLSLVKKITKQNINYKMNTDLTNIIISKQENFEAYLSLRRLESDSSMFEQTMKQNLIPFFNDFAQRNNLKAFLLEESLLTNRNKSSSFYFENSFLKSVGLKLSVNFGSSGNNKMSFGLSYYNQITNDTEFFKLVFKESKNLFRKVERDDNWLTYTFWWEFGDWSNIETLYRLAYGDFKEQFEIKMLKLLTAVHSVHEDLKNEN